MIAARSSFPLTLPHPCSCQQQSHQPRHPAVRADTDHDVCAPISKTILRRLGRMGAGAGPWGAPEDLPIQTRLVVSGFQVHAYFAVNVPFYLPLTLFFLLGLKTAATASIWLSVVSDPPWSPVICHQFSSLGTPRRNGFYYPQARCCAIKNPGAAERTQHLALVPYAATSTLQRAWKEIED